jgi:nucleoside-diphosphate-sugar epimerase
MRILIAGGTGVIGRRVIPELVAAGHEVTAVARSAARVDAVTRLGARPLIVDLFDAAAVARAVAGHETVINLTTRIPPSSRAFLPGAWRETNRIREQVSKNLADASVAAGVQRMVQESFAPTYPDRGDQWITEDEEICPARYNRGVADAERAAAAFTLAGGTGIVLRFAYFYGAESDFTRTMIAVVRKGFAPTPVRRDAYISSIALDDAASAVVAALQLPSGTYNVCDDEPVTHEESFNTLAALLHVAPPRFLPPWTSRLLGSIGKTLARSHRISNRKLRTSSKWAPRYPSVREGWAAVLRESSASTR